MNELKLVLNAADVVSVIVLIVLLLLPKSCIHVQLALYSLRVRVRSI
jgi:hypothetical protein